MRTELSFAALGAKIAICDVKAARAEETVALAVAAGGDGVAVTVDVGDEQGVAGAIASRPYSSTGLSASKPTIGTKI
jgi:NAD(P)-dependent dehydrogenase (short-subunit alcohol dehydrogenase family)